MKKIWKKLFCFATALLIGTGGIACMAPSENYDGVLLISVANVGNGYQWCVEIAEAFTEKTGIETEVKPTAVNTYIDTTLPSGPNNNPVDIYMGNASYYTMLNRGVNAIKGYDYARPMLDITEVFERDAEGYTDENGAPVSIKIKDLLDPDKYEDSIFDKDGKNYFIPYISNLAGLIYNKGKFEEYGLKVPRTTDELIELCEYVRDNDKIEEYPIVYCGNNGYWRWTYNHWWVQYDGLESFRNFFTGKYNGSYEEGWRNYASRGRYAAMEVFTELTKYENGFCDPQSSTYTFTQGQLHFLEGNGLMIPTGDWIEQEMIGNFAPGEVELGVMHVPLVSSIVDRLPSFKGSDEQKEETLRDVIDYVDGKTDVKPAGVEDEDIDEVRAARNLIGKDSSDMFIPVYSDMAEEAKDFIQFYFSKQAQELLLEYSGSTTAPLNSDYPLDYFDAFDTLSEFQQTKIELFNEHTRTFAESDNHAIVYAGGAKTFYSQSTPIIDRVVGLNPAQTASRLTGIEIYEETLEYYSNRTTWQNMLKNAGLA